MGLFEDGRDMTFTEILRNDISLLLRRKKLIDPKNSKLSGTELCQPYLLIFGLWQI